MTYTTIGDVRGGCGHQHRTVDAAEACRRRDSRGAKAQGGYSDRAVVRGDGSPLDQAEDDREAG